MRKILFVMFAALAFVACDKDDYIIRKEPPYVLINWGEDCKYVNDNVERKKYPYLDVQNGGEVKFTTSVDVFFPALEIYDKEGNKVGKYSYKKTDTEWNFEIGVIKKIGECSYKIEGFPNNSDNYKCLAIYVHSIDEKVDANSMVVFLDENALIE